MNLLTGTDFDNIILHVNPRLTARGAGSTLVINSRLDNHWGEKVESSEIHGVSTRVALGILVKEESFVIFANGLEIIEFEARPPLTHQLVERISFYGDFQGLPTLTLKCCSRLMHTLSVPYHTLWWVHKGTMWLVGYRHCFVRLQTHFP